MRISDWNSDLCSSDLNCNGTRRAHRRFRRGDIPPRPESVQGPWPIPPTFQSSGSARRQAESRRFEHFFRNVPEESGMAFVVVVHLAPERQRSSEEHTSELLSLIRIAHAVILLKQKKHLILITTV